VLIGLIPSIVVNAVLPVIAFGQLTDRGWSSTSALIATSVFPVAATLFSLARSRTVDGLSVISLALIAVGIVGTLLSGNPRFGLVKESVLTGAFGLVFAASLLFPRPLAFYFGRQFATGGDPARLAAWNSYWVYPQFRRVQYTITIVWAVALVSEAAVRVVLVFVLSVGTMVWLSQVIFYAVLISLLGWMFSYIGRSRARAVDAGVDVI
jgi:hypothetical protein